MSRWLTRWRAALRIARREAWRSKGRTVLVVLLMMLPVAAGTFLVGVLRSSLPTTETTISWEMGESAQARLELACGGLRTPTKQDATGNGICAESAADLGELSLAELEDQVPAADEAVAAGEAYLSLRTDDAITEQEPLLQVDTAAVPGLLGEVTGEPVPVSGQAVLGHTFADRLHVGVGDTVEIVLDAENVLVDVVGVGNSSSRTAAVLGPGTLPDGVVQPVWFVTGSAPVIWAEVVDLNEIGLTVTSRAVLTDPPPPGQVYNGMFGQPATSMSSLGLVLAVVGLVLLEIILLIGPAFAVGAKRGARSLALVAASGGEPADLRRIVLAGGLVTGMVAAVLGVLLGTAAGPISYLLLADSMPNLVIPVWEPLAIGLVAVVLGVVAAWFPARSASRADVVTVLAGRRGERPARRRVAWIGFGFAALGMVLSVVAAATSQALLLAAGVMVLELGLVIASGFLVALTSRLAPRFGIAGRFALRDAHRHRSRTAPAVAAVLAAVAGASAGMVYMASEAATQEVIWQPVAADGTGLLSLSPVLNPRAEFDDQYQQARDAISAALPDAAITPVRSLISADGTGAPIPGALQDPATVCPDPITMGPDAADERCREAPMMSSGYSWGDGTIVDDGAMVATLGLAGAEEAARALAEGQALTNDPDSIWPDGNLHVALLGNSPEPESEEILIPAHLVDWAGYGYGLVLPPEGAEEVISAGDEWATTGPGIDADAVYQAVPVGATVTGVALTPSDVDRINRQLSEIDPNLGLSVEGQMNGQDASLALVILLGVAVFVALAATGLSVGLAVADSRADLATLAAVGASPRVRRRITAAQAGVIASVGAVVGVVTGILLGYVLGLWQRADQNYGTFWQISVPWPYLALLLFGLPLLAIAGGWLLTRSRLPVRRRAAS